MAADHWWFPVDRLRTAVLEANVKQFTYKAIDQAGPYAYAILR